MILQKTTMKKQEHYPFFQKVMFFLSLIQNLHILHRFCLYRFVLLKIIRDQFRHIRLNVFYNRTMSEIVKIARASGSVIIHDDFIGFIRLKGSIVIDHFYNTTAFRLAQINCIIDSAPEIVIERLCLGNQKSLRNYRNTIDQSEIGR